jgi:hypothetical protein
MTNLDLLSYRLATIHDGDFICSTWLATLSHLSPHKHAERLFNKIMPTKIANILKHSLAMMITVPADEYEPEIVLGYQVYEYVENYYLLHFAYTKSGSFRQEGYQTACLQVTNPDNLPIVIHTLPQSEPLTTYLLASPRIIFDPYLWCKDTQ